MHYVNKLLKFCSKVSLISAQPILQHAASSFSQQHQKKFALEKPLLPPPPPPFVIIAINDQLQWGGHVQQFLCPQTWLLSLNFEPCIPHSVNNPSIGGTYSVVPFNICSSFQLPILVHISLGLECWSQWARIVVYFTRHVLNTGLHLFVPQLLFTNTEVRHRRLIVSLHYTNCNTTRSFF